MTIKMMTISRGKSSTTVGRGYIGVRNAALLTLRLERVSERLFISALFL
jgi:hypothetical protein